MMIKRKWLMRTVPSEAPLSSFWVNEFYLSLDPEVVLKSTKRQDAADNWKYFICVNNEIETTTDGGFYLDVLSLRNCAEVHKSLLVYPTVKVNVVLERPSFVYAEAEFGTATEAMKYEFPWPDLVLEEVTDNPDYNMKNYWSKIQ